MKHPKSLTIILIAMFFLTQLIGLYVVNVYSPKTIQTVTENGTIINETVYNLPFGTEPPKDVDPKGSLISIVIAIIFAVAILLLLMKYRAELILRTWFLVVITLALAITFNALLINLNYSQLIALIIALPLAIIKIFKRNLLAHNATELLIYPGIAAIFIPLLNIWTTVLLLVLISIYDMYAVWHAGFMQKMAKYQIEKLKVFSGFFVPYMHKQQKGKIQNLKMKPKQKNKKVKVNVAILGGGDVVFPIILAGVVFIAMGLIQALAISVGATIALAILFILSEKGKFYPAMPFISTGCFLGLAIAYLI